jgi:hypothetical protein
MKLMISELIANRFSLREYPQTARPGSDLPKDIAGLLNSEEGKIFWAEVERLGIFAKAKERTRSTIAAIEEGLQEESAAATAEGKNDNEPPTRASGGTVVDTKGSDSANKGNAPGGIDPSASLRVNSQQGGPGGIDFRGLPIVTQPMPGIQAIPGTVPLGRPDIALAGTVPVNDKEWLQIQKMLDSGITPSVQRIKEYLQTCCEKSDFNQQIGKILSCIADILRIQEDNCYVTDSALKDLLVLLESDKPAPELKLALSRIQAQAKEPNSQVVR